MVKKLDEIEDELKTEKHKPEQCQRIKESSFEEEDEDNMGYEDNANRMDEDDHYYGRSTLQSNQY